MKTEFKIVVYFINFLTPGKRVYMYGTRSLLTESNIFTCFFFTCFRITHPFLSKCMLRMRKPRKSNLIQIFFWRTKVSEPVSKRDWHNMRSYLFFNMQKFRTQCAETSRFCMQVRRFSRQDCFYKSLLLHWKWHTPVSGQVFWVRNGHKWGLWCVITTCQLIITDFPGGLECTRSSKCRFGSPII